MRNGVARCFLMLAVLMLVASPAIARQTGSIAGKVTATDGSVLPGVTVEAKSDVLPSPRVVVSDSNGDYRLPALPPGTYTITFTLPGMQPVTLNAQVQLNRETAGDMKLNPKGVSETVTVVAQSSMVDRTSASLTNNVSADQMKGLPLGQDYRDLIRLIPGVPVTPDTVRGPSAGASGQDNVFQFDGVNVTLPLFGTLSAEPANPDVQQLTIVRGGARAVDFDRAGGFLIDSISKSGTSRYTGQASFQFQSAGMVAATTSAATTVSRYDSNHTWTDFGGGGPIVKDKAYFYASYYRPTITRSNGSNFYGALPEYDSTRNEGFGKVTLTPMSSVLINASYRDSHRLDKSNTFSSTTAPTAGSGNEAWLNIGMIDANWVIDSKSYATMKYTHFINRTQGRPDNVANVNVSTVPGTHLDIANLNTLGAFAVPSILSGQTAYNTFVTPIINQYGYNNAGVQTGGGTVGYSSLFDHDDFFRDGVQFGYNYTLTATSMTHTMHAGLQWYRDSENLTRSSNGWGVITVPGGRTSFAGTPIFYQAAFQQQTTGAVPTIHSEYESRSLEFNDQIAWKRWTFNAGILISHDTLFGQGLREDASTLSGYVASPGTKYQMYDIPFSKMEQPRLGATWAYDGRNTIFVSYAKYNPAASSLPRAASWDRNLATTINAYFDANGNLFGSDNVKSSSGKLFVPDMTPRTIKEVLFGTARQMGDYWTMRAYGRYRSGTHYWEDTNNSARVVLAPPPGIPQTLYIPTLAQQVAQIGSGSSYVIADLDGSYTKYWEGTVEAEYSSRNVRLRASYTRSHYYGNFDQDGSAALNDSNIFIGSSNIGDDAGRQLWNNKDGDLHGDRPNSFKLYGAYQLKWHASAGAFLIAQSGTPWEAWNYLPTKSLQISASTSDTDRYAEPAGSRRTDGHFQMDFNYTQNLPFGGKYNAQVVADLFNAFNSQTGYNIQQAQNTPATFGLPQSFWDPRRFQLAFRFQF